MASQIEPKTILCNQKRNIYACVYTHTCTYAWYSMCSKYVGTLKLSFLTRRKSSLLTISINIVKSCPCSNPYKKNLRSSCPQSFELNSWWPTQNKHLVYSLISHISLQKLCSLKHRLFLPLFASGVLTAFTRIFLQEVKMRSRSKQANHRKRKVCDLTKMLILTGSNSFVNFIMK